jgi:hypothetical protein
VTCQVVVGITDESKDDVHTRGGEGGRHVRSRLRPQNKGRYDVQSVGGEGDVRSQLRLQNDGRDDVRTAGVEGATCQIMVGTTE